MDVQNLEKNQQNKIIKELCDQGAGFSQLARITGISYGIIQRVVTDQSPLILLNPRQVRLGECNYDYIEVISGLESGEQVIVSDMTKYKGKEKMKVE